MHIVYYSKTTLDAWDRSFSKFNENLKDSLLKVDRFKDIYSPLSDVGQICRKEGVQLKGLTFRRNGSSRYPIRNIVRVVAKLGELEYDSKVCAIHFQSMKLRCDTFEGEAILDCENMSSHDLKFRWKWTDFDGGIDYNKFSEFILRSKE